MAEIGDYGASAICKSKSEAFRKVDEWRKFRVSYGGSSVDYVRWAIWYNGGFVVGNWPNRSNNHA